MIIVTQHGVKEFSKRYSVQCDLCSETCKKGSVDPGDAAELARGIGWSTRAGILGDPLTWVCPKCSS